MAKLHKITLYLSDSYWNGVGDGLENFQGDLYHGDYNAKIAKIETVEVDGPYDDNHRLNDYAMWNGESNDLVEAYFENSERADG